MPAPKRGPRLGAGPKHQKLLLAQQAGQLFRHGRIRTTETKAKTLRPYAERLITKAKQGDLPARRAVLSKLRDRDVVAYLFEDVAPRFADRNGGYTRLLKLGPRPGDNAPMALVELVEVGDVSGEEAIEESRERRSRGLFGRRRRQSAAPAQDDALEFDEDEESSDDESTSEDTSESTSEDTSESTSEDTSESTSEEPADETEDVDEDAGLEAQAPPGPAQEPSAPDDPTVGNPVGPGDTPDAGKGTGKDAGRS